MMTKNNSSKKATRARMAEAGEVYSVAKRNLHAAHNYLDSPWESLNTIIGGFKKGNLYVVASRPSEGKSTFALNLATHFATNKNFCIYVNMELNRKEIVSQVASSITEIPYTQVESRELDNSETLAVDAARKSLNGSIIVYETGNNMTPESISSAAYRTDKTKVIIVDYLELMQRNFNPDGIPETIRYFKKLAIELDIPIIVVSQLSRVNEFNKVKPTPNMLIKTSVQETADVIIVLSKQEENLLHVNVTKNRQNATGELNLLWRPTIRKLVELPPVAATATLNGIM